MNLPNRLTVLRVCMVPVFVVFMLWNGLGSSAKYVAAVIFILASMTDWLDGYLARKNNLVTDFGKFMDPIADKLTQIVMLACLLTRFGNLLFPCVLLIVKEIVTGCMGIAVIRRTGKVLAAEWHGKLTTFLLYTLMIAHVVFYNIAPVLSDTLIIICTAMMCFSFLLYMMRNIRALKSVGKKTEKKPERTVQAFER